MFDSVYTTTARTGAGVTVGPTGQQLTTAYGGSIAFEHGWNAEWRTSVFGGAQVVDYNDDGQRDPVLEVGVPAVAGR